MSDYLPKYFPGDTVTILVGAGGVTGGLLVNVSGVLAGAGDSLAGVAGFDAVAGATVTVWREGIHRLKTSATVTLGQPLKATAGGTVAPWVSGTDNANLYIGDAWSAAASGALADAVLRY